MDDKSLLVSVSVALAVPAVWRLNKQAGRRYLGFDAPLAAGPHDLSDKVAWLLSHELPFDGEELRACADEVAKVLRKHGVGAHWRPRQKKTSADPLPGSAHQEGSMDDRQKQDQGNDEQAVHRQTTTETETEVKLPVQPASTGEIGADSSERGKGESAG